MLSATSVNYVTNGQFETDTNGWYPFNNNGSQSFGLDAINPLDGNKSLFITITQSNSSSGNIADQWMLGTRWGMSTFKNGRYSVHFKAKASRSLKLVSMFQQNFPNWVSWGYVEWNLTTSVQDFNVTLDNNQAVGGYWAFCYYYGHLATGDKVWIDDIQITEISNGTGELTDGNVCNGDFESNIANLNGSVQGWQTVLSDSTIKMSFAIDSIQPISGSKSIKITNNRPPYQFNILDNVFGYTGSNRYAYCPTVIKENNISHIWFCGNPTSRQFVDNIYYMRINADGTKTIPISVLQPGASGKWDDHHTCDPSVIKGNFIYNNTNYQYAMFYLGCNVNYYYNEIGVAFSNSLSTTTWVKYPTQIVPKTWTTSGDYQINANQKAWGVGQPSAISLDQKGLVLLSYTIGDVNGTRVAWVQLDLRNMTNFSPKTPQNMISTGLKKIDNLQNDYTDNTDLALDSVNNVMVMIRPVQPNPTDYPNYISQTLEIDYIPFSNFLNSTGSWNSIVRITPDITLFPRNHNACIERNGYGKITNWQYPLIYYTVSNATPTVQPIAGQEAEWSYNIWRGVVQITEVPNGTGALTDGNVCNGDFEANIANINGSVKGWQVVNVPTANLTYGLETTTPISGTTSMKATAVAQGTVGWQSMIVWNFYPVMGMNYSIQFKAKATVPVTISAEIWDWWNNGNRYNNLGFQNFDISTTVQSFSYDFQNPVSIYFPFELNFWLGTLPAGQSIWIDDVRIYQTGTPDVANQLSLEKNENISVKSVKSDIFVNVKDISIVNIYNLNGQQIVNKAINVGESKIIVAKGIYIVQVLQNGIISKSTKVIVK